MKGSAKPLPPERESLLGDGLLGEGACARSTRAPQVRYRAQGAARGGWAGAVSTVRRLGDPTRRRTQFAPLCLRHKEHWLGRAGAALACVRKCRSRHGPSRTSLTVAAPSSLRWRHEMPSDPSSRNVTMTIPGGRGRSQAGRGTNGGGRVRQLPALAKLNKRSTHSRPTLDL